MVSAQQGRARREKLFRLYTEEFRHTKILEATGNTVIIRYEVTEHTFHNRDGQVTKTVSPCRLSDDDYCFLQRLAGDIMNAVFKGYQHNKRKCNPSPREETEKQLRLRI